MIYTLDERSPQFIGDCWVAPNATVIGQVRLESGASVWYNAVLRGDCDEIVVGENSNVQDGSVLHTDPGVKLIIGRDCTIGHMVMLHGCEIGDNTLIGIGSVILNRVKIGKNCIVGAKSLIPEGKSFPDNCLIMGAPAKVVREVSAQEAQFLKLQAEHYVQNARRHREKLRPA
ncbi:MAG TPA: gamma carbonic anhydrase family protein [Solimonas sp.]|nr:gamma carbonic anhydrase family protein [Solimonas sp.]